MDSTAQSYQALQMGLTYDLKVGGKTIKTKYLGEVGGWHTFRTITGKFQEFQYSPEQLPNLF